LIDVSRMASCERSVCLCCVLKLTEPQTVNVAHSQPFCYNRIQYEL